MLSVHVITSLGEFKALTEMWNSLLRRCSSNNIFLTWEWLYTWATHYLGEHQLWILLVYRGGNELVGIAPLYIQRVKEYGLVPLRELKFLGTKEVCSSYLDFIVPERHKKAVLHRIYQYLHGEAKDSWDAITLSKIPAESSTIDFWEDCLRGSGQAIDIVGINVCPVIRLSGSADTFLQGISRNERHNLRRKQKRLEQAGHVVYERMSSNHDLERALDTFIRLHQMRWEKEGTGGVFGSSRFLAFHRELVRVLGEKGWIYFDFLWFSGQALAGIYGFSYNHRYSFYLPGFNPLILPGASPGILLLFQCVKEAIREGHNEFDLLQGAAQYKMAWANGLRRSLTFRIYNRNFKGRVLGVIEQGKGALKALCR